MPYRLALLAALLAAPLPAPAATLARAAAPRSILMAGSESVPFIKTGGLADVVDALSRGMAQRGHKVMLTLPFYRQLKAPAGWFQPAGRVTARVADRDETAELYVGDHHGVKVVLIGHDGYYGRENPYDGGTSVSGGVAYSGYDAAGQGDADERFGFFARASLAAAKKLRFRPDIAHVHDWHAALIPLMMRSADADPFFDGTRSVLSIHNAAFQGNFPSASATKLGVGLVAPSPSPEGRLNFMRAGVAAAHAVLTVSPSYAKQMISDPRVSLGLEDMLAVRGDLDGIAHGVDTALVGPDVDRHLPVHYDVADVAAGKAANKAELQRRLGLDVRPDAPVFGIAARMAHQKGVDLVVQEAAELIARGAQLAIAGLGSGEPAMDEAVLALRAAFPGSVGAYPFDVAMASLIYAGSDFLLMPSRFEPCGLSQLFAQRYGTLPIVSPVGGLLDTVVDLSHPSGRGDGFVMRAPDAPSISEASLRALALHADPAALARARRVAMTKDVSWTPVLEAYEAVYERLLADRAGKR